MRAMPSRRLTFSAGESASAPMTWGQLAIWTPLRSFGEDTASFNLIRTVVLARSVTDERFLDAVRALVERHTSLRTHFADGQQRIAGTGELSVAFWTPPAGVEPAGWTAEAAALAADSFDLATQWPVRFAAVLAPDGGVVGALVVTSHVAADGWAADGLAADLRALLEPGPTADAESRWDPLDQLAFERSEAGQRKASTAIAHWAGILDRAPASMFDFAPLPVDGPLIGRYRFASSALASAASVLAARSGTSTSTVVLALTAMWLADHCGHDTGVFELVAGNRLDSRLRVLRAPAAQDGLVALPVRETELITALRAAFPAAIRGFRNAQYHPADLAALKSDLGVARGLRFDLAATFNHVRLDTDWVPISTAPEPAELAELRTLSTFTRLEPLAWHDKKFMLSFNQSAPDRCGLLLLADARYLPAPVIERFARGVEEVACAALYEDLSIADVLGRIGVPPVDRGPDWVRTRAGWARTDAVRDLVAGAVPGARVLLCRRPNQENLVELEAWVAVNGTAGNIAVDTLHRDVVSALTVEAGVVAPDRYVISRGPVRHNATEAEWAALPVLDSGSGR